MYVFVHLYKITSSHYILCLSLLIKQMHEVTKQITNYYWKNKKITEKEWIKLSISCINGGKDHMNV